MLIFLRLVVFLVVATPIGAIIYWLTHSIFVSGYLAIGLTISGALLAARLLQARADVLMRMIETAIDSDLPNKAPNPYRSTMRRARRYLGYFLEVVAGSILWPASLFAMWYIIVYQKLASGAKTFTAGAARGTISNKAHYAPIFTLGVLVSLVASNTLGVPYKYLDLVVAALLVSIAARQLIYATHVDYPQMIRVQSNSPYVYVFTMAAMDLAAAVLAFMLLYMEHPSQLTNVEYISGILGSIFEYKKVMGLLEGHLPGAKEFRHPLAAAFGGLFAIGILGLAKRHKEFAITDPDHLRKANLAVLAGDFQRALTCLDEVDQENDEFDVIKANAYLGLGKIDEAQKAVEALLKSTGLGTTPERLWSFNIYAAGPISQIEDRIVVDLIKRAVAGGIPDSDLARCVLAKVLVLDRDIVAGTRQAIDDRGERYPLTEAVLNLTTADNRTVAACLDRAHSKLATAQPGYVRQ